MGTAATQERPTTAPPGMMTPMHILSVQRTFQCRVRGHRVERLKVSG